jgi:hypothetical protein
MGFWKSANSTAIPNLRLIVLGEPYAGGVAPQTPIGGRYAALQTSHVGVDFAELPRLSLLMVLS